MNEIGLTLMQIKKRKIKHLSLVPVILITLLLYKIISHPEILPDTIGYFLSIFSYIIWAFSIAFLLNPLMVFLEKKFKLHRIVSILVIYLFFLAIIIVIAVFIVPVLISNSGQLINSLPDFASNTQNWIFEKIQNFKAHDTYNIYPVLEDNLKGIVDNTQKYLGLSLNFIAAKLIGLTSMIIKFILGLLISIYMLSDKENLIRNIKKLLYAVFKDSTVNTLLKIGARVNISFSKYLIGKFMCAAIIGILCFLGFLIMGIPFALLLSILVGVTNLIPYIGGFIGMIPSVIIVFLADPIKALWALIILLLLQQLDSWVLSPKIIGDQTGLSPLLIITALLVGGATFGILGMFLSIPIFAVGTQFLEELIDRRLKEKNIEKI
jgi:predicted PurR-regulated permease PerM